MKNRVGSSGEVDKKLGIKIHPTSKLGKNAAYKRELQAWKPDNHGGSFEAIGFIKGVDDEWDQFRTNEQKFGYIKSIVNEDTYTTSLDRNSQFYQSRIDGAENLSNEILALSSSSNNLRLSEERKHVVFSQGIHSEATKISTRSAGSYIPPAFRNKPSNGLTVSKKTFDEDSSLLDKLNGQKAASGKLLDSNHNQGSEMENGISPNNFENDLKISSILIQEDSNSGLDDNYSKKGPTCVDSIIQQDIDKTCNDVPDVAKKTSTTKFNINAPEFHPRRLSNAIPQSLYSYYYTPNPYSSFEGHMVNNYPFTYPDYQNFVYDSGDDQSYHSQSTSPNNAILPVSLIENQPSFSDCSSLKKT